MVQETGLLVLDVGGIALERATQRGIVDVEQ